MRSRAPWLPGDYSDPFPFAVFRRWWFFCHQNHLDFSPFVRLPSYRHRGQRACHGLTHRIREDGTTGKVESLGSARSHPHCLVWMPRNPAPLALFSSENLAQTPTGFVFGWRKPDQSVAHRPLCQGTWARTIGAKQARSHRARLYLLSTDGTDPATPRTPC